MQPDQKIDIFSTLISLHWQLFSCALSPEYGGTFRSSNSLIMGAKFETVGSFLVILALLELLQNVVQT